VRWIWLLLLCGCGYQLSFKIYGVGRGESTVFGYDPDEDRVRLLDLDRYNAQTRQLYRQFFPNTVINPGLEQLRKMNPVEFERLCRIASKVRGCKEYNE
jgi:hypothetical protein